MTMNHWMRSGILLVLISLWAGCNEGGTDAPTTVTQAQNGQTVPLAKGGTLIVELAGNPTTGYEWTVARNDEAFLKPLGSTYAPDASAIGSGGLYAFRFEALQSGTPPLGFAYRRPWETTTADQTFTVTVNIQ